MILIQLSSTKRLTKDFTDTSNSMTNFTLSRQIWYQIALEGSFSNKSIELSVTHTDLHCVKKANKWDFFKLCHGPLSSRRWAKENSVIWFLISFLQKLLSPTVFTWWAFMFSARDESFISCCDWISLWHFAFLNVFTEHINFYLSHKGPER